MDATNALDLGAKVTFSFRLPQDASDKPVTGEGVVTWSQQTVGMGIRFTRMSRSDWERIKSYVQGAGG